MAVRNPPLYPRMRERPEHFRLNLASPLTPGLLYAVIPSVRCSANDEIWDLGSRVQFRREAGVGPVSLTWEQDIHRLGIAITDSSILQQNGYETIDTFAEGIFCFGWYLLVPIRRMNSSLVMLMEGSILMALIRTMATLRTHGSTHG